MTMFMAAPLPMNAARELPEHTSSAVEWQRNDQLDATGRACRRLDRIHDLLRRALAPQTAPSRSRGMKPFDSRRWKASARRYFKKNPDTIAMTRIAAPRAKNESTGDSARASERDVASGVVVMLALATLAMNTSARR